MKTKLILILTVLLAGCNIAIAQSPYATRLPAELQTAQMDSLADVTWLQGTTPAIRVEPLLRGRPVAVDADTTVRMVIGPSATGTLYAVRTNLATVTNAYEIQWPTIGTNSAGEAWFYTLFFDRAGYTYWSGSGKLYIEETTSTASNGLAWIEYTTPAADIATLEDRAVLRSIATVPASAAYSAPASESLPFVVTNTVALTLSGLTDGSIGIRLTTTNASGVALYAAVVKDIDGETLATINPACDGTEQSARWPWNASETLTVEATGIASPAGEAECAIITAVQAETWEDVSLVGRTNDLSDQHLYVDYPAATNEAANRAYADDAADAALALALGEIATATFNRDLAGYVQRWSPRFDTVAASNSLSTLYGGSTALRLDGEGATVVPEIRAFAVEAGEVATLTVWSYSGGATNLVPEVTTNLITGTWEKKPESIVSATNIDAFTAQVVFTNDFEQLLYVRVVDVSGGSGVPVLRVFGGIAFGDGEAITDWPQGTILGATVNEPHTVATNDGILAFTVEGGTGDGSLAEFVATHTNSLQITNSEIARLELVAGDNVLLSHVVDSATSSSVVRVSASSAIAGPQGPPGVGGLVYAGTYDAGATYTNPATLVSFGRATYYTTNQWAGGGVPSPTNTDYWTTFVPGGEDGADGSSGADGVGFNFLGPWSTNVTSIGTNDAVAQGGQLFAPWVGLSQEGGIPRPVSGDGVVNTNDYYVLVAKGADGASGSVSSNLFFAGNWESDTAYPEMSVVVYSGQAYYATEAITGPSYPIPGGAPWATFAARGATGPRGVQGVDGIGNLQFKGFFDLETLYPSNSVVAYPTNKPDWYRAKALVSGQYPTATNYWEKVLMSGLDASVFGVGYSVGYNPSTYYPSNHWLRHNGAVYASRQPVTGFGNQPPNATYWTLVVRDGTTLSTGLVWRGEWAAGTYVSNDLVSRAGSSYFVNTSNTTQTPPNSDWTVFVQKGDTGPQGPAGTAAVYNVYYQTNLTVLTQNVWNVTNNSYYVETNVYDTFLSHTSIVTEIWVTNEYTNLGVSSADAYRGDWGAYVSNRADAAYQMASAASSVAGATNLVIGAEETSYDPETRTIYSPAGTGGGGTSVGVEGDVLTYAFATNIALLASTNLWPQRIIEITNDFTLQVPTMADTNAAGIIWLTVPSISTHTATIPTSSPAILGYVPALSTNAESELIFRWTPQATGWRVRRIR